MSDQTNRKKLEDEAHLNNLEALVNARTEQLRQALNQKHELLESIRRLQSLESLAQIKEGLRSTIEKFAEVPIPVPKFGGEPGEPVPVADPEDLKAVWQLQRQVEAKHGSQSAIEMDAMKQVCTTGADIQVVFYRTSLLYMLTQIAPEQITPFLPNGQPTDGAFYAAANVPVEWMGVGIVTHRLPFDVDEFVRLCGDQKGGARHG
jgi:hypothetical protein